MIVPSVINPIAFVKNSKIFLIVSAEKTYLNNAITIKTIPPRATPKYIEIVFPTLLITKIAKYSKQQTNTYTRNSHNQFINILSYPYIPCLLYTSTI